ncbi:MAG: pantetheine-phosphate adenylyltransferase [Muribaculaceae bacterium]|nr:pantetheine-phosphate adenylyltransferase [Muribaculaceae bacterium]MBQ2562752.1 pantetheine-phosphate adenylyltransferase [Muribaculaceae bacterium]
MKTSQCTDAVKRIAMFQGSFDPFTLGHESIVRRALPLFDEIVVAVVSNIAKQPFMSLESRMAFIKQIFAGEPRVRVVASDGLTVDVARQQGASCLLRGVRMIQDFENEMHMAEINRRLGGIETVLLYTLPEFSHISSSIVRELYRYGQDVSGMLPASAPLELLGNN